MAAGEIERLGLAAHSDALCARLEALGGLSAVVRFPGGVRNREYSNTVGAEAEC